jgi:hypothetical protein
MPISVLAQVALGPQEDVDQIYQIVAGGCPTGQIMQTGFRVRGLPGIVTALHGVVGCRTITAHGAGDSDSFPNLNLTSVDLARDVALLTTAGLDASQGLLPISSLEKLRNVAQPGAPLMVVGYPGGRKGQTTTHLNARRLRPLREEAGPAADALNRRGSPSLDTTVLGIEGHLVPAYT